MKKLLVLFYTFIFLLTSNVEAENIAGIISNTISEYATELIPGEGITEVNIEIQEHNEPDFTILGVRDISKKEDSNLFTQFSLHNNDVSSDERYIGNLGLGYRKLTNDKTLMLGINSFVDKDFAEGHGRVSIGLEAKASNLEFVLNNYEPLTTIKNVSGTDEKVLGRLDYKLTTQIPYMPWTRFGWQGYKNKADLANSSNKGDIYSLELVLTPSFEFDISRDISNHSDGNIYVANLTFIHPPKENKANFLVDGFLSNEIFFKENMEDKLSDKVERNNNLVVEVQGAVVITSK